MPDYNIIYTDSNIYFEGIAVTSLTALPACDNPHVGPQIGEGISQRFFPRCDWSEPINDSISKYRELSASVCNCDRKVKNTGRAKPRHDGSVFEYERMLLLDSHTGRFFIAIVGRRPRLRCGTKNGPAADFPLSIRKAVMNACSGGPHRKGEESQSAYAKSAISSSASDMEALRQMGITPKCCSGIVPTPILLRLIQNHKGVTRSHTELSGRPRPCKVGPPVLPTKPNGIRLSLQPAQSITVTIASSERLQFRRRQPRFKATLASCSSLTFQNSNFLFDLL